MPTTTEVLKTAGEGREFTDNEMEVAEQIARHIIFCVGQARDNDVDPFAVIEATRQLFTELYREFLKAQGLTGVPEEGAGE